MPQDKKTPSRPDKKGSSRAAKRTDGPGASGARKAQLLEDAITQMNAGKYARASGVLKELLALDANDQEARRLFATLQLRIGSLATARMAFDAMVKEAVGRQDFWLAESLLKEYLAAGPRCVPFLDLLGQVLESKGDPDAAAKEYAKAAEILIEDPDSDRPNYAQELLQKIKDLDPHSPAVFRIEALLSRVQAPAADGPASESSELPQREDTSVPGTLTSQEESQSVSIPETAESSESTGERARPRLPWEDDGHNVDVGASSVDPSSGSEAPVSEPILESPQADVPAPFPLVDLSLSTERSVPNVVATDELPSPVLPVESAPVEPAPVVASETVEPAPMAAIPLIQIPIEVTAAPPADAVVEVPAPTLSNAASPVMAWDDIVAKFSAYAPGAQDQKNEEPKGEERKDGDRAQAASLAAPAPEPEPEPAPETHSAHAAHRIMGEDIDSPSPHIETVPSAEIASASDARDLSAQNLAAPMPWEQIEEPVHIESHVEVPTALEATGVEPVAAQEAESAPTPEPPVSYRDSAGLAEGPIIRIEPAPVEAAIPIIRLDEFVSPPREAVSEPVSVPVVPAPMPWEQIEDEPVVVSFEESSATDPVEPAALSVPEPVDETNVRPLISVEAAVPSVPVESAPEPCEAVAPAPSDAPSNDQLIATILDQTALKDGQPHRAGGIAGSQSPVHDAPRNASPEPAPVTSAREPEPIRVLLDSAIVREPVPNPPAPPVSTVPAEVVVPQPAPVESVSAASPEVSESVAEVPAEVAPKVEPEPVAEKKSGFSFFPSMFKIVGGKKDAPEEPVVSPAPSSEPDAAVLATAPSTGEVAVAPIETVEPSPVVLAAPTVEPEPTDVAVNEPAPPLPVEASAPVAPAPVDAPIGAPQEVVSLQPTPADISPVDVPALSPEAVVEQHQVSDATEAHAVGDVESVTDGEPSGDPAPSRKKRGKKKAKRHAADEIAAHATPDQEPPAAPMAAFVAEPVAPAPAVQAAPPVSEPPVPTPSPAPVVAEPAEELVVLAASADIPSFHAGSQVAAEPSAERPSQRDETPVLSMSSAKAAKPRESRPEQDGPGVWSHVAGAAKTGGRAASSVTKLVGSLAAATIGVAFLAVAGVAITWSVMNQQPSATFQELIGAQPQTGGDAKRSGYMLLADIGLSDTATAALAGSRTARYACYDAVSSTQASGTAGSALSDWFHEANPAAAVTGKAANVKEWASQSTEGLGRYRQWLGGSGDDGGYGRLTNPNCAGVLAVHRLYVAEPLATGQGLDAALDRLEGDLAQWRSALRKAQSLEMKMLAVAAVNDDLRVLSGLLLLPDFDGKYYGRAAKAAVSLDQAERSLRWPMHNQLQIQRTVIDAAIKNVANVEQPWYVGAMSAMPLPTQRMLNGYADYYQALIKASEESGEKFTAPTLSTYVPPAGHGATDYLLNPVASAFEIESAPAWETYVGQVRETDALLRLVSLQVWLRKSAQESTGDAKTRVAKAGQNYYDPFTGFPMLINASKGLLYSVGSNGRDEDGMGPGDVSVMIPPGIAVSKK